MFHDSMLSAICNYMQLYATKVIGILSTGDKDHSLGVSAISVLFVFKYIHYTVLFEVYVVDINVVTK